MKRRTKTKYVHEGQYVAEVEVALIEDETDWSAYVSIDDAYKLDDVRNALRQGNLESQLDIAVSTSFTRWRISNSDFETEGVRSSADCRTL